LKFDLSKYVDTVYDQSWLNACWPAATVQQLSISGKQYGADLNLSWLQLYYEVRDLQGERFEDNGTILKYGHQAATEVGIISESLFSNNPIYWTAWPGTEYRNPEKVLSFNIFPKFKDWTVTRDVIQGQLMQGKSVMLASDNLDFTDGTGIDGGHAGLIVGFDDSTQQYKFLNSWGNQWGDHGYKYIAYTEFSGPDNPLLEFDTINGFGKIDYTWSKERIEVASYYPAIFGRTGDYSGVDYWADQLSNGMTEEQVINSFFSSPEFVKLYGETLSASTFINSEYKNILGREPDTEGALYWSKLLNEGMSFGGQLGAFLNAAEQSGDSAFVNNRTHVSAYGAITLQDDGSHPQAEKIALVGVTSDPSTIQKSIDYLYSQLYGA